MLRTACLTLFSILGCSTLFAQNRPSLEPFDIPGDVVSKPSNPPPAAGPVVAVSTSSSATVTYPPQGGLQNKQAIAPEACVPGRKATGLLVNRRDSASDCLDRLSNWFFYRNPPWPKNCGLTPTPYQTPGYAYFYHPTASESRPCGNLAQPACSGCAVEVTAMKPEAKVVVKSEPRPLIPNTSAALAQPGARPSPGKLTSIDVDGEPYYFPRITPPSKSNSNGATLPDPNR